MGPERDLDAHACVSCLCACCSHPGLGRSNGRAECVVWTEGSLRMITGRFWKFSPARAHLYPTQEDPRRGLLAPQIPMDDAREGYIPKPLRPSRLDDDVAAVDIAELGEALPHSLKSTDRPIAALHEHRIHASAGTANPAYDPRRGTLGIART